MGTERLLKFEQLTLIMVISAMITSVFLIVMTRGDGEDFLTREYFQEIQDTTIPLVFHIMYTNDENNISATQIYSAIDDLNTRFSDSLNISFTIAKINRIDLSKDEKYKTRGITLTDEAYIKNKSIADPDKYLNIWVVCGINGNMGQFGVQSYASLPNQSVIQDGIVVIYKSVGTRGQVRQTNPNKPLVYGIQRRLGINKDIYGHPTH